MTKKTKKTISEFTKEFKLSKPFRWIRIIFAPLLWMGIFIHIFVINLGAPFLSFFPSFQQISQFRFLIILGTLALLWLILHTQRFLSFIGYIIFYPLILVCWHFPRLLFKNWPTAVIFTPAIYTIFKNLKLNFVLFTIALILGAIIMWGHNSELIISAMVLLGAYLLWHYVHRVRNSFAQSTVFGKFGRSIRNIWENAQDISGYDSLQKHEKGTPEYEQAYGQSILNLYLFSTLLALISKKLKILHESKRLDLYFISSLFYTFFLTSLVFTLEYHGLSKLDTGAFSGEMSFQGFIGYSFGTLAHYQLSTIVPISGLAQFITYLESFSSFVIGMLLVFIILTSVRERYHKDIEVITGELTTASNEMERLLKENYALTLQAAEKKLIEFNEIIAGKLLRLRYDEETAKMIEKKAITKET